MSEHVTLSAELTQVLREHEALDAKKGLYALDDPRRDVPEKEFLDFCESNRDKLGEICRLQDTGDLYGDDGNLMRFDGRKLRGEIKWE